jgi:hypothetical protein
MTGAAIPRPTFAASTGPQLCWFEILARRGHSPKEIQWAKSCWERRAQESVPRMHEGGAQVQGRLMVVRDLLLGRMAASNLAMSRSCRDSASRYLQISPSSIVFSNSCVWSASFFPILTKSVSALNFLGEAICATQPAQQSKKAGPRAQQRRSLRLVLRKSAARARKSGCLGVCGVPKKCGTFPRLKKKWLVS